MPSSALRSPSPQAGLQQLRLSSTQGQTFRIDLRPFGASRHQEGVRCIFEACPQHLKQTATPSEARAFQAQCLSSLVSPSLCSLLLFFFSLSLCHLISHYIQECVLEIINYVMKPFSISANLFWGEFYSAIAGSPHRNVASPCPLVCCMLPFHPRAA